MVISIDVVIAFVFLLSVIVSLVTVVADDKRHVLVRGSVTLLIDGRPTFDVKTNPNGQI